MENIIGVKFKNRNYQDIDDAHFKSAKLIGIYFSSSRSPPCELFLKKLLRFHKDVNIDGPNFQILNVPYESTEIDLKNYIKNLPFSTIPFNDNRIKLLNLRFKIEGVPSLVILDYMGNVVTTNGRKEIVFEGEEAYNRYIKDLPSNILSNKNDKHDNNPRKPSSNN